MNIGIGTRILLDATYLLPMVGVQVKNIDETLKVLSRIYKKIYGYS